MSKVGISMKIKAFLGLATVASSLAVSTGQLTAAGLMNVPATTTPISAAAIGRPMITETAISADDSPAIFKRAGAIRDSLGFPAGAARSGRHVHDGIQKADYDEVAEVDARGRPISLTQLDGQGRLVTAVRLDTPAGLSAKMSGDQAVKSAQHGLEQVGLATSGRARVQESPATGGWDIHWDRSAAGAPVRGDETLVHVWQDGHVQSVARVEHDLAAAPAAQLNRGKAQDAVGRQMDKWFAGRDFGYAIQGMDLQWVGPNATFDPGKVGVLEQPYRLAWVANVAPSGSAAEYVRLITLYVDAGDGSIIGGDVVE